MVHTVNPNKLTYSNEVNLLLASHRTSPQVNIFLTYIGCDFPYLINVYWYNI